MPAARIVNGFNPWRGSPVLTAVLVRAGRLHPLSSSQPRRPARIEPQHEGPDYRSTPIRVSLQDELGTGEHVVEPRTADVGGSPVAERAGRLLALDWMRFLAAGSVLCFHYLFNGVYNGKIDSIGYSPAAAVAKYGYLGVDLFFLISGFVIAYSVRGKTARQFAVSRGVRLYPAFWVAVLITATVTVFLGHGPLSVTPVQVLANLTMVHQLLGQPSVDGVYWTLFVELQFYGLVFIVLLLRQGNRLYALFPAWAIAMLAASLIIPAGTGIPYIGGYFFLFASGAVIGSIRDCGWSWLSAVGLAAGFIGALLFEVNRAQAMEASKDVDYSPVLVAVAVTSFFLALLSFLVPRVATLRLPHSRLVGGLTYPLYLIHAHIGYMVISALATPSNKWVVYTFTIALVLALAWILHEFVERRPHASWVRLFDRTAGRMTGALEGLVARAR